jgi:hypothetical protein
VGESLRRIGLELDPAGWTQIKEEIAKANRHGVSLDRATLFSLVTENSKQRFEISPDGEKIRPQINRRRLWPTLTIASALLALLSGGLIFIGARR